MGSCSTRLRVSITIVGRSLALNAGHRGSFGVLGFPVRAKAIHASLTLSASAMASGPPPVSRTAAADVVERERNLDRVRRLQTASIDRCFPSEIVQVDRSLPERRSPLRNFHHRPAVAVVTGDEEVEIRRCGAWIRSPVDGDGATRHARRGARGPCRASRRR